MRKLFVKLGVWPYGPSRAVAARIGADTRSFPRMSVTVEDIARALGLDPNKGGEAVVREVEYDSRRVEKPGTMFVAVPGDHTDGHRYVAEAVENGAVCVMTQRPADADVPQLIVPDGREAMAMASHLVYGSPTGRLTMAGITGTNGKTTVTYLLESILAEAALDAGVVGTVNYRYSGRTYPAPHTTPESPDLARLLKDMVRAGVSHCVMEVSSHALDQSRVGSMGFDVAVFTNLTHEHLDYHGNMEEYYEAKSALFRLTKAGGTAVINVDDPWGKRLAEKIRTRQKTLTVSLFDGADVYPGALSFGSDVTEALVVAPGTKLHVRSSLVGEYNLQNILVAVAAARAMGVDPGAVERGIERLTRVPGRLEPLKVEGLGFRAFVDYAHTPDALERAIEALRSVTTGRLITVVGCGGNRDRAKRPEMGGIAAGKSDVAVITSDNPRDEDPLEIIREVEEGAKDAGAVRIDSIEEAARGRKGYLVEPDRRAAIAAAVRVAREGDTVLVAGKGHEDYQIVRGERLRFDDMEVLAEAVEGLVPKA